jgi:hypothetical protein
MINPSIALDQPSNTLLLIAPIFGLLGIVIGWWLNWTVEKRRRLWQLQDRERQEYTERSVEQERWRRDQRVQRYVTLVTTAHALEDHVETLLNTGVRFGEGDGNEEFFKLYERLDQEVQILQLFASKDVYEAADKLRNCAVALLKSRGTMPETWRNITERLLASFHKALQEYIRRVTDEFR